jgi:hypothetical protein
MKLSEIVSDERLLIWGEFDGVPIQIEYVDAESARKMVRSATKNVWKKNQQVEELDGEKFARMLAEKITDWKMTVGDTERFFNLKPGADPKEPVECDSENKIFMMENCRGFASWLENFVLEIRNFQERKAEENEKN